MTRSVLITGSSDTRALGFTVARLLAQDPHRFKTIILSGRDWDKVQKARDTLQAQLNETTTTVAALQLDVSNSDSIARAFDALSTKDGSGPLRGAPLDVLVNNAGLGSPTHRSNGKNQNETDPSKMFLPTNETDMRDIVSVMTVNVGAVAELTNALLPLLSRSEQPRVVNVSSARGSIAFAASLPAERTGAAVYNMSKTALNMLTVMQSKTLPTFCPNLKVNAASPGHVKTPFNNFTGIRTLEEGAEAIVYLATIPQDGPNGSFMGNHAPFSADGTLVDLPW